MYIQQFLRKRTVQHLKSFHPTRRFQSTIPPNPVAKSRARIDKVLDRVPRFLRGYTDGLRNAPVSHIVSFLILHEITAVVPLVGLTGYFHYSGWLPPLVSEGAWVSGGIEKFGNYFRRKGYFGLSKDSSLPTVSERGQIWNVSESGAKIVVEVATAYAITKVLIPARLLLSVWATPWFARVFIGRFRKAFAGFGRKLAKSGKMGAVKKLESKGLGASSAAGTGATGKGSSAVLKDTSRI